MLYWLPGTGASSARLYWESFGKQTQILGEVGVPTGCSIFPKEIFRMSRRWAEKRFTKLVYWNELERGGHFAAFEQPETFVNEVRACFRKVRADERERVRAVCAALAGRERAAAAARADADPADRGGEPGAARLPPRLAAPRLRSGPRRRGPADRVRRRRAPGLPAHREPRDGARRHAVPAERRRAEHGGADDPGARHRGAEAALRAAGALVRGDLVPGFQRAGRRLGPGEPADERRAATATAGS